MQAQRLLSGLIILSVSLSALVIGGLTATQAAPEPVTTLRTDEGRDGSPAWRDDRQPRGADVSTGPFRGLRDLSDSVVRNPIDDADNVDFVGHVGGVTYAVAVAGDYAYVGSAFGAGGFGRAERHRRKLGGEGDTVHWHVDALTTHTETSFVAALLVPERAVECAVARELPPGPYDGFGSSDCDCRSHLSRVARTSVERAVLTAVDTAGSA